MARLKNIIQKTEALGVVFEAESSDVLDIIGGSVLSCQVVVDVESTAKTFASPHLASLANQSLTYTSVNPGLSANDITIALTSPGSGTHALAVSTVADAISVSLQSTAAVAATGALDYTADVTLTSVATGTARNTQTFKTVVNAAAANPTNTVLVAFTGTAAAIICTVTPNDGTNNGAVAVNLSTAQLRELITTGAVVGKNITLTDASAFRILQTATGGGATNLAHGGEGDNVTATFSGGANFALISTGNDVKAAVNADGSASLLVLVSGTQASVVTTLTATHLANGADGVIDLGTDEITITAHGYGTGVVGRMTKTGTLPTPFLLATDYFVIVIDENTIQFAASENDAHAGVPIDITDAGSNNNVTTFTPTTLSGGTVTLEKSNDRTNWATEVSAVNITADGAVWLEKVNPSAAFYRATFAISAGSFDCNLWWVIKGIDG